MWLHLFIVTVLWTCMCLCVNIDVVEFKPCRWGLMRLDVWSVLLCVILWIFCTTRVTCIHASIFNRPDHQTCWHWDAPPYLYILYFTCATSTVCHMHLTGLLSFMISDPRPFVAVCVRSDPVAYARLKVSDKLWMLNRWNGACGRCTVLAWKCFYIKYVRVGQIESCWFRVLQWNVKLYG